MIVTISSTLLDRILTQAAKSPAEEVCGLLLGRSDRIEEIAPAANVAADRSRCFEVDPVVLVGAYKAERAGGPAVIGHYHSHPNGAPLPSARDATAAQPGRYWMIVAGGRAAMYIAAETGPIEGVFTEVGLAVV